MDAYSKLIEAIIQGQERIIGPLAVEQAQQVSGLEIDWSKHAINLKGDKIKVVERLVEQYEHLFGQTSVEVCREAASPFLSDLGPAGVPELLR
jgi:hypothetical protein